MRLWSLHPKYLDAKGLTACWREGLLARKVLLGQTTGYRYHPQLIRFRNTQNPIETIDAFLSAIHVEAQSRGYNFDGSKIDLGSRSETIEVTQGQLQYEFEHLKRKLQTRDKAALERINATTEIMANPIFSVVDGAVESWEVLLPITHNKEEHK